MIIPIYNNPLDTKAFDIYREAMPGYKVVGINCESIIHDQGAVHCITKEIGARAPIFISHADLDAQSGAVESYVVRAQVKSQKLITDVCVFYKTMNETEFRQITMKSRGRDVYAAVLPRYAPGTIIHYYIQATERGGKTICKPLVAPAGYWSFAVRVQTHVEKKDRIGAVFQLSNNSPNPFNESTTISFALQEPHKVCVKIFDLHGRLIQLLTDREYSSGYHTLKWPDRIEYGFALSSGHYLYSVQAGSEIKYGWMTLLK